MAEIRVVTGHEPVTYKRYGKRTKVRTYRRLFMVANLPGYDLESATAKASAYAKQQTTLGETRYVHVTMTDGTEYMWTPSKGWFKKSQ